MPVVTWSERGLATGKREATPVGPGDHLLGACFMLLWQGLGLLAWPLLLLHPAARRHLLGLVAPEPGMTWLHGASAGEHAAARALAPLLSEGAFRTSSSWRTPVAGAFPAPLDLPWVAGRWLDRGRPGRLILVEAELWPGWLVACRRRGIPVAVVNARPGQGTARWRRLPGLWRWLTEGVVFVDQADTGDLKLAAELREATFHLGRDAFLAASTRPGDEARLLAAWATLPALIGRRPRPLLVLAPRHLERTREVILLIEQSGLSWARRSVEIRVDVDLLLLDSLGELGSLMPQARAVFVGGTFDPKIGGHSPAEAFSAGLPVVHGPHTHANPTAWQQGIAIAVAEAAGPEAMASAIRAALGVGPGQAGQSEAAVKAASLLPDPRLPAERAARPWLFPLVPLVRAVGRRQASYAGAVERIDIPVVSVGALVAGGAGKTPVVGWLARQLPGAWVVGRGYRRGGDGGIRVGLPGEELPDKPLGDELEMLRRQGISVISAPDRVAGAREAARRGARLVILDDGFQHRRLHRELDLVCIDARWPDGRGPIPVGWRREPWSALTRAHWIWEHHAGLPWEAPLPELPRVRSRLIPTGWLQGGHHRPLPALRGAVDVVVGIARPEGFLATLIRMGLEIRSLRILPDHGEIGPVPSGAVMTEKDAARLPPGAEVWALETALRVEGAAPLLADIRRLL